MSDFLDEILDGYFDIEEDQEEKFRNQLAKKLPPYSPENTVYFYGYSGYYLDRSLKKTDAKGYHFVKIARTFPLWDEEVKIEYDGKLSEASFDINKDGRICVPYREEDLGAWGAYLADRAKMRIEANEIGMNLIEYESKLLEEYRQLKKVKDSLTKVTSKEEKDKLQLKHDKLEKEYGYAGKKFEKRLGINNNPSENFQDNWIFIYLRDDIITLNYGELRFVQSHNKKEILSCQGMKPCNKAFFEYLYSTDYKYKVPGDVIYWSLVHITNTSKDKRGLVVGWTSDMNGPILDRKYAKVFLKTYFIFELEELNWKKEGFDFYSLRIMTASGKYKVISRKELVSRFRKEGILLLSNKPKV